MCESKVIFDRKPVLSQYLIGHISPNPLLFFWLYYFLWAVLNPMSYSLWIFSNRYLSIFLSISWKWFNKCFGLSKPWSGQWPMNYMTVFHWKPLISTHSDVNWLLLWNFTSLLTWQDEDVTIWGSPPNNAFFNMMHTWDFPTTLSCSALSLVSI